MIRITLALILAFMTGCSTAPTSQEGQWLWQLSGKLYYQSPGDRGSANLYWQHNSQRDIIQLSGPLGQGATRFIVSKHEASLWRDGEMIQTADSIETLLAQHISWSLPIEEMRYWVKGLIAPTSPASYIDVSDTVNHFEQSGWDIAQSKFNSDRLPTKLIVKRDDYKLTLLISQWTL